MNRNSITGLPTMINFQAIIFDLDGVIINSERLWDRGTHEFLKTFGHQYQRDQVKHLCTGKSLIEGTKIIQDFYRLKGDTSRLAEAWKTIVKRLYREHLSFIDGFQELASRLQTNQILMAIATSSESEFLEIANRKLGLDRIFHKHIYTLKYVGHVSKPQPDIFLYAAKQLGIRPEHCVIIEDSPIGILAAKNAGMFCIALKGTYDHDKLEQADAIAADYDAIHELLF